LPIDVRIIALKASTQKTKDLSYMWIHFQYLPSRSCLGFLQVDAECLEAARTLVLLKHDQGRVL
jgi:hypothetical protein